MIKTVIILVSFFLAVTDEKQMKEKAQGKVGRNKNSVGGGSNPALSLFVSSAFFLPLRHTEIKFKITIEIKEWGSFISACSQHKVVFLVVLTIFAVDFWLIIFLAVKLWVRIPFQTGDSPSALFLNLCVNLPAFWAVSSVVTIDFKLGDIKLESSEAQ